VCKVCSASTSECRCCLPYKQFLERCYRQCCSPSHANIIHEQLKVPSLRTEYGYFTCPYLNPCPRGLKRGSAVSRFLGLCVRIPPGTWMFVSCECCMLSDRGLCIGMITRPEESYRVWCVWVWSWSLENEEALAHWGLLHYWRERKGETSNS